MSARYSTSPTLRLPIAESRICALWQGAFIALLYVALVLLALRGYPWGAAVLTLPVTGLIPSLCRQTAAGQVIIWRAGQWSVERDGLETAISLHPASRASVLGICLCWSGSSGKREYAWLFADSAPPDQLRRLRVRLALEIPA